MLFNIITHISRCLCFSDFSYKILLHFWTLPEGCMPHPFILLLWLNNIIPSTMNYFHHSSPSRHVSAANGHLQVFQLCPKLFHCVECPLIHITCKCDILWFKMLDVIIDNLVFLIGIVGGGTQLDPLCTVATKRPIVPTPGDYDNGEIGGMIVRGNRSTRIKPALVPLCPPQTPHSARTRTRAAAVGIQRLTTWATARPR
jgi:hypothetical protein